MDLHPILKGAWCVPSAIQCLTGADYESVIMPAINRHSRAAGLMDGVVGVSMTVATDVLTELRYRVRRYRGDELRAQVRTWARRSLERYPGRALLVATGGRDPHAVVIRDGRVYDTFTPAGAAGAEHPFAHATVTWCALVEEGQ